MDTFVAGAAVACVVAAQLVRTLPVRCSSPTCSRASLPWADGDANLAGAKGRDALPPVTVFSHTDLRTFCCAVFEHHGVPREDAAVAAEVLVLADLRGIDSHGVARLASYSEMLGAGAVNATPRIAVHRHTSTTAVVDGDNGLGLVVGPAANRLALEMAREHGSGHVAVRNTNHFGACCWYILEAVKQDCIGMAMTNTTALVTPHWGAERMLGTNPIAVAVPGREAPPIVVDMATSAVAYGKIEIAERLGKPMPLGWAVDDRGRPTSDPGRMRDGGAMLPLGSDDDRSGHKGYCLSAWVDVMCALLSGANWGPFAPPFSLSDSVDAAAWNSKRVGKGIGHFFSAWRVDGFRPADEFKGEVDAWRRCFSASKPAAGRERVLVPGDPELAAEAERRRAGVPVTLAVVNSLRAISESTGVPLRGL